MDDETGAPIDERRLRKAIIRYARAINYCTDLENGMITITHTEYLMLPATLVQARRIFKQVQFEHIKRQQVK
jgi:hypothetical protein